MRDEVNRESAFDNVLKAGNEGDICKHPALIAALDKTITDSVTPMRYADVFAGYATTPLNSGKEWTRGIGVVAGEHLLTGNAHIAMWAEWANLRTRPQAGGTYPGSAWFARQVGIVRNTTMELSLWDTGGAPLQSLNDCFSGNARIFNRAANPQQPEIRNADFAFFDPPSSSHWEEIKPLINALRSDCSVMVWLPIATDQPPEAVRGEALSRGFGVTEICWGTGEGMIGCQLLYRVNAGARAAIGDAVGSIVDIAREHRGNSPKWTSVPIHFDPY